MTMPDTHPSSDVLERVARALATADGKDPDAPAWVRYPSGQTEGICWRDQYRDKARAAIAAMPTIERLSAELERVKRGGEQGVAADALDFACGHCKPEEALAFLEDWRFGRAVEWPGFVKWLARQRACAAEARALSDTKAG